MQLIIPASCALMLLSPLAAPQGETLILTGDDLPGIGKVVAVQTVSVADSGDWVAHVATDHPDLSANEALLKNGVVWLREGDPIAGGATVYAYGDGGKGWPRVTAGGAVAWSQFPPSPSGSASELLFDGQLLFQDGDLVGVPGLSAVSTYTVFYEAIPNDARQLLVQVRVVDPAIGGLTDYAVLRIQLGAAGLPISKELLLKEGEAPFGEPLISSFPLSNALALNELGDTLLQIDASSGSFASSGGILLNELVVAQLDGASPVFGRTWRAFHPNADLGDGGDYAFSGRISGDEASDQILVWNGIKVIQEGESIPAFAPFALEKLEGGTLPEPSLPNVFVDAHGHVLWFGDWDDPDESRDTGILLDHELVLQEGVSVAAGQRIDELGGGSMYELSDDGRYLVYIALLEDGRRGAFRLDLEASITPRAGCTPNLAQLAVLGDPTVGGSLSFEMTAPQSPSVAAFVAFAGVALEPCGFLVPGAGELLIGAPFLVLELNTAFMFLGAPAIGGVDLPSELSLVGATVQAQGLFFAPTFAAEPLRLSDAYAIHIAL
jgi:hypothetical protein